MQDQLTGSPVTNTSSRRTFPISRRPYRPVQKNCVTPRGERRRRTRRPVHLPTHSPAQNIRRTDPRSPFVSLNPAERDRGTGGTSEAFGSGMEHGPGRRRFDHRRAARHRGRRSRFRGLRGAGTFPRTEIVRVVYADLPHIREFPWSQGGKPGARGRCAPAPRPVAGPPTGSYPRRRARTSASMASRSVCSGTGRRTGSARSTCRPSRTPRSATSSAAV